MSALRRSTIRAARVTGLIVLLMGSVATPARSQCSDGSWNTELATIDAKLRQALWEPARQAAQTLTDMLVDRSGGTPGDHRAYTGDLEGAMASPTPRAVTITLARAAAYRAIAEAALDRRDEARWHWYLAQNLSPELRRLDLAPYGTAGAFLRQHVLADSDVQHADLVDVLDPVRPEPRAKKGFQQPTRIKAVYPQRPADLRGRDRFSHVVFVQVTVDATGQLVQPLVVDAGFYPGLISRAFDALREWRYQPATLNGKPISFRYVVPVAFADDRVQRADLSY
jgi:hypothetical protein